VRPVVFEVWSNTPGRTDFDRIERLTSLNSEPFGFCSSTPSSAQQNFAGDFGLISGGFDWLSNRSGNLKL
jgi:hypothetical protein